MPVPTRQTSEADLDQWNIAMRNSPGYQNYIRSLGKTPGDPRLSLSRKEQSGLENVLKAAGLPVTGGMHIDQGGNLNQKNRLGRNIAIAVGLTAATIATAGAAGFGPLAGALGSGGAGAGAAAGGTGLATVGGGAGTAAAGGIGAGTAAGGIGAGTLTGGGAAVTAGSKIATALKAAKTAQSLANTVSSVRDAVAGGTPSDIATRYGNMADQAAMNRMRESQIAQAGPGVDAAALANVVQTGKLANYTPPPAATQALWDKFGKRMPAPDATTSAFARDMQAELSRRLAAGEPLTLSGVSKPSAQEAADTAQARQMAMQGPNGGGVAGALQTGAQIAGAVAPSFDEILKKFGKKTVDTSYNPATGEYS